MVISARCQQN